MLMTGLNIKVSKCQKSLVKGKGTDLTFEQVLNVKYIQSGVGVRASRGSRLDQGLGHLRLNHK